MKELTFQRVRSDYAYANDMTVSMKSPESRFDWAASLFSDNFILGLKAYAKSQTFEPCGQFKIADFQDSKAASLARRAFI